MRNTDESICNANRERKTLMQAELKMKATCEDKLSSVR